MLLTFPGSYRRTRRADILRSDSNTQAVFLSSTPAQTEEGYSQHSAQFGAQLQLTLRAAHCQFGADTMISAVPGRGDCPAMACCCKCLPPVWCHRCWGCSVLCKGVPWGSALGKAGPALTSHFSYSFASDKPFLSKQLSQFSKTLTHITTSFTNENVKNRNTIYSQLSLYLNRMFWLLHSWFVFDWKCNFTFFLIEKCND